MGFNGIYIMGFNGIYPLVMTNIAMENRWPIEIDGLPFLIAWWIFPWQTVSHNQRVNVYNVYNDSTNIVI